MVISVKKERVSVYKKSVPYAGLQDTNNSRCTQQKPLCSPGKEAFELTDINARGPGSCHTAEIIAGIEALVEQCIYWFNMHALQ